MEIRLQKFVNSMVTLSDIRNLDLVNPVVFNLEHPATAMKYVVIVAEAEPSYMGVPINATWVVININSPHHLQCLKLLDSGSYSTPIPGVTVLPGFRQCWKLLDSYDEIFDTPQYYDTGAGLGIRGPQGFTGPMGFDGPPGPAGAPGTSPVLDYDAIAREVSTRIPPAGEVPTLELVGPSTVLEGAQAQYSANLVIGSDSYPLNIPIVLAQTTSASITPLRVLTANSVSVDTTISLTASTVYRGQPVNSAKSVVVTNSALTSIALSGLSATINESRTAQLMVTSYNSNGSYANVTQISTFVVSGGAGTVSASGLFTASMVADNTPFTVTAEYTESGVTRTAVVSSSVVNVVTSSLTISGPASVRESTTAQFVCTATKTDSTTSTVTPLWSVNPSAAGSISASGLFTAAAVSSDTQVTISASYTADGVTVSDTHVITVTNVQAVVYPYYGSAGTSTAINEALILGLISRGTSGSRAMPSIQIIDSATTSLYYAYPVSYGLATFTDLGNGFQGGWDGAHKDAGNTAGPVTATVMIAGVSTQFYVYQADYPNISPASNPTNWSVT